MRPKNLRANPREIVAETRHSLSQPLQRYEGLLAKLHANASDAEANLVGISEQRRALDGIPNCPLEMLTKVADMMETAQSSLDEIRNQIESVEAERATAVENGGQMVVELITQFMKHVEESLHGQYG